MIYKKRPTDGSQKAWDYVSDVYGKIKELKFMPNCCGPQSWIATLDNGRTVVVDSKEIKGLRNNLNG
jgi:hypothetical protein